MPVSVTTPLTADTPISLAVIHGSHLISSMTSFCNCVSVFIVKSSRLDSGDHLRITYPVVLVSRWALRFRKKAGVAEHHEALDHAG